MVLPSDASRATLDTWEESTFNAQATGTPKFDRARATSVNLQPVPAFEQSDELDAGRNIADLIQTGLRADLNVGVELSASTWDNWFRANLMSPDWTSQVQVQRNTYGFDGANNQIDDSSGSIVSDGFLANRWYHWKGFSDGTLNNIFAYATARDANSITFAQDLVGTEAAGQNVTLTMLGDVNNGNTFRSWNAEVDYDHPQGASTNFLVGTGLTPGRMSWNAAGQGVITGSFDFIGGRTWDINSATIGDGDPVAKTTTPVMSGVNDMYSRMEGTALDGRNTQTFSISTDSNLRQREEQGILGSSDEHGLGRFNVTGEVSYLFKGTNPTLLNKVTAATNTALATVFMDSTSSGYLFHIMKAKFTTVSAPAESNDQDVTITLGYQGQKDPVTGFTLKIARFTGL